MNRHTPESTTLLPQDEFPLPEENPGHDRDQVDRNPRRQLRLAALRLPQGSPDHEMPSRIDRQTNLINHSQPSSPMAVQQSATVDTEDSTSSSERHESPTVKIDHSITVDKASHGAAWKLTKPMIALIGGILLLTTGSAAYFFTEFLTIPGLKTQVDRLEEQVLILESEVHRLEAQVDRLGGEVDRLGHEVDRLSNETNRLAGINDDLEDNIDKYEIENDRLNSSVTILIGLNGQLNTTTVDLMIEVEELNMLNQSLVAQNQALNETVTDLAGQIIELQDLNARLTRTTNTLWISIDKLTNETIELSTMNEDLNLTVVDLRAEVTNMTVEIDRLNSVTFDLATLVTFLNETATDIDQSFEDMANYLAEQIESNRALVVGSLENLYRQKMSNWDCDFSEFFLTEPFASNRNVSIGAGLYEDVLNYIDDRVLSDLCLDVIDFEAFLIEYINSSQGSDASFNQLQQAVGRYTGHAIQFYFAPGLTTSSAMSSAWAEANYDCNNLPLDVSFRFSAVTKQMQ